jgi:hypothetical protein
VSRLKKVPAAAAAGFLPLICVSGLSAERPWVWQREGDEGDWDGGSGEDCSIVMSIAGGIRSLEVSGATSGCSPEVSEEYTATGGYVGSTVGGV